MAPSATRWISRLREWRRAAEFFLARRFGLATREDRLFLLLIGVIGLLAGFLGVAVHRLIDTLQRLLWGSSNLLEAAAEVPLWQALAAPAAGGLMIALIVVAARGPAEGPGMGILIESVALRGGRVPVRPILVSSLAAIATVGSGGSLGREGPMIRLGAMLSSRLGSKFRLPPHRVKILVGCGAAAGLAAAIRFPSTVVTSCGSVTWPRTSVSGPMRNVTPRSSASTPLAPTKACRYGSCRSSAWSTGNFSGPVAARRAR
jgi:H+/Cl- antiporter ClcA